MPGVLALFAQSYPQIDLKVQVNSTRIVAKNIMNREIDLAIVGGDIPNELKKKINCRRFCRG